MRIRQLSIDNQTPDIQKVKAIESDQKEYKDCNAFDFKWQIYNGWIIDDILVLEKEDAEIEI